MENAEIDHLLNWIKLEHGYDFLNYKKASLRRRLEFFLATQKKASLSEIFPLICENGSLLQALVATFSIHVTEMFRDPDIYRVIREKILPKLATFSQIKIWSAGCSSGLEPYSLAILLAEADLLRKSQIYATDISSDILDKAKDGIFEEKEYIQYSQNYYNSGGQTPFSEFFHFNRNHVIVADRLKKHISFFRHNLTSDTGFIEVQLIVCSNVMIYFNEILQKSVLRIFYDSLHNFGYLVLGSKEKVPESMSGLFEKISHNLPVYKKVAYEKN